MNIVKLVKKSNEFHGCTALDSVLKKWKTSSFIFFELNNKAPDI